MGGRLSKGKSNFSNSALRVYDLTPSLFDIIQYFMSYFSCVIVYIP